MEASERLETWDITRDKAYCVSPFLLVCVAKNTTSIND